MLHVNERVIARVVGPDGRDVGTGEWGRLVVTDLANFVMPFINYTVGDAAISGGLCPCGRGLPTIARLEGRDTEIIETPDGRVIAAGALGQLLTFVVGIMPYVWEYQAVHAAPTSVRLLVVPTARFSEAFRATVERAVQDFLGPAMRVTVEPVSAIPLEPSGKRLIIRRLPAG
jgi:phenylacetate-CoA ligase